MTAGFRVVPNATITYEGLSYRNSMPSQAEIEFELRYHSPCEIEVADVPLDFEMAQRLLSFLQQDSVEGPVPGLSLAVTWIVSEAEDPLTPGAIDEVTTWLTYALGVEEYDGSYDVWEA